LALKSDGTLVTWGSNYWGETIMPAGLPPAVDIACGAHHSIVKCNDGLLRAWGFDDHGQAEVPGDIGPVLQLAPGLRHNAVVVPDTCVGDILTDRIINGADLGALLSYWGPVFGSPVSHACDLNADGQVDGSDLGTLLSNWGSCPQ
jgi:hypothetical protein